MASYAGCDPSGIDLFASCIPGVALVPPATPGYELSSLRDMCIKIRVGPPEDQPIAWAFERKNGGRTFNCTGPHFHQTFDNQEFRRLLLNAIHWVAQVNPPEEGVQFNP